MYTVKVFLSYSHADRIHRDSCLKWLQNSPEADDPIQPRLNVECYKDTEALQPGDDIPMGIRTAIETADIALALLSLNYLRDWNNPKTTWPRREWDLMFTRHRRQGLHLIPVLLEPCNPTNSIPQLEDLLIFPSANQTITDEQSSEESLWYRLAGEVRRAARRIIKRGSRQQVDRLPMEAPTPEAFLMQAVTSGRITPVLGPDCHAMEANRREGRRSIRGRRDRLMRALESLRQEGDLNNDVSLVACRAYIEGVIEDNFGTLSVLRAGTLTGSRLPQWEGTLTELMVSLVRGSVTAVRVFARAMENTAHGPSAAGRYAPRMIPTDAERKEISGHLGLAAAKANAIADELEDEAHTIGLGAFGMGRRLEGLAKQFRDQGSLALSELEWLGELLWHIMRFDAPMYPSAQELGLQLALCGAPELPPQTAPASTVALSVPDASHVDLLRHWFEVYGRRSADARSAFYESLAGAMCQASASIPPQTDQPMRADPKPSAAVPTGGLFVPIAISCNFDQELEKAMERLGCVYHVVFPVLYQIGGSFAPGPQERGWLLRTKRPRQGLERSVAEDRLLVDAVKVETLDSLEGGFEGPVVVKLHGSPLEQLPPPEALTHASGLAGPLAAPVRSIRHRIVLSDYQILVDALRGEQVLPPGLEKLLKQKHDPPRRMCFFGFPLRDPNSRLRIYLQREFLTDGALLQEHPEDGLRRSFASLLANSLGRNVFYYPKELDEVAAFMSAYRKRQEGKHELGGPGRE